MTEHETPRVEALIDGFMPRFPGVSASAQARTRYYEEVHQHLAPLARELERETRLQKTVAAWAAGALPAEANHLAKLKDELIELEASPGDAGEMADVLLALMLHAESYGVDLLSAGVAKLKVVQSRVYGPCDERGVSRHLCKWKIANSISGKILAEITAENEYKALDEMAKQHGFSSFAQAAGRVNCPVGWGDVDVQKIE